MGVVIESSVWEPNSALFLFLLISCILSIFLFSNHSRKSSNLLDHANSPSFLRFQRTFLLVFSLASGIQGVWSVFGEHEFAHYGLSKQLMVFYLCFGCLVSVFAGPLLGMLSDCMGQKKFCLIFCILHIFVGVCKRFIMHPSFLVAGICLSIATSVYSISFETWMVLQHDKQGHRQDALSDTFWLMTFFESASLICSQALANWRVGSSTDYSISSPSTAVVILSLFAIVLITRGWAGIPPTVALKEYSASFYAYIFGDKRIWLLAWAQACISFSMAIFWILWAPTIVADGREVNLGLIYPCLMGARMLGSTVIPWLICGSSSFRTEDYLVYALSIAGVVLCIVAYDYQDIGTLVTLYCLFHACVGLILPSLARLRSMHVPNEFRGGMLGLSLTPASTAVFLFFMQRGYYQNIGNSVMMAFAALGMFAAAGCMYLLRRWGKQPYQNWHKL